MQRQLKLFHWSGIKTNAEKISGTQLAFNEQELIKILENDGIILVSFKVQTSFFKIARISRKGQILLTTQLKVLLEASIPLVDCFKVLASIQDKGYVKTCLCSIYGSLESGMTLALTLKNYPNIFNNLFINLIEIGEETGRLDLALANILQSQQASYVLKQKIKKALSYPLMVLLTTLTISMALMIWVVPKFEEIFSSFDAKLPLLTRIVINLSNNLIYNLPYFIAFIIVTTCIMTGSYKYSARFKYVCHYFILKIPVCGQILFYAIWIRFLQTLSTLLVAGIPINESVVKAVKSTGNVFFITKYGTIDQLIAGGKTLSQSLVKLQTAPDLIIKMIQIGEESGRLCEMLTHIANHYLAIVQTRVELLGELLEPFIMLILGAIIGTLVIAMYLPIFNLMSVIGY